MRKAAPFMTRSLIFRILGRVAAQEEEDAQHANRAALRQVFLEMRVADPFRIVIARAAPKATHSRFVVTNPMTADSASSAPIGDASRMPLCCVTSSSWGSQRAEGAAVHEEQQVDRGRCAATAENIRRRRCRDGHGRQVAVVEDDDEHTRPSSFGVSGREEDGTGRGGAYYCFLWRGRFDDRPLWRARRRRAGCSIWRGARPRLAAPCVGRRGRVEAPRARGSDRGRRAKPRSVRGCGPASRFELSATEPLCLLPQGEAPARRTRQIARHL